MAIVGLVIVLLVAVFGGVIGVTLTLGVGAVTVGPITAVYESGCVLVEMVVPVIVAEEFVGIVGVVIGILVVSGFGVIVEVVVVVCAFAGGVAKCWDDEVEC
ncbi:uncharacterized [Tachysurus ichikawai]